MSETKRPETYADLYPGRFLKAEQFKGKEVTLTIKDVYNEELIGENKEKATKAIFSFKETHLQHVAPKTNGLCMKFMFGHKISDWIGKRVTFFPSEWNGEPAIRIAGSPDIDGDMDVEIKLPQRKAKRMRLRKIDPKQERKAS